MKSQASWVLVCINLVHSLAHPVDVESSVEVIPNSHHDSVSEGDVYKALKYNYGGDYKFDGDVPNINYKPVHENEHDISGQNYELDKQHNNNNINLEWSDQYKLLSDKTLDNDFYKYLIQQLAKDDEKKHNEHAHDDGSKHKEHDHDDVSKHKDKTFSLEYGINIETDLFNNKYTTAQHDSHQKDEHNQKPHHNISHNHDQHDLHGHPKHQDHHQQNIHKGFKLDKYLHGHYDDFHQNMTNHREKLGKNIFIKIPVPVAIPKIYTLRIPKPYPDTVIKPVYYPVIKKVYIPIPAEEWKKHYHKEEVSHKHDTHVVEQLQHLS